MLHAHSDAAMISILSSTAPLSAKAFRGYTLLLRETTALANSQQGRVFSLQTGNTREKQHRILIWIFRIAERAHATLEEAAEALRLFSDDDGETHSLVLPFQASDDGWAGVHDGSPSSFVLVSNKLGSPVLSSVDLNVVEERQVFGSVARAKRLYREFARRPSLYSEPPVYQWRVLRGLVLAALLCAIGLLALSGGPPGGHPSSHSRAGEEPYIRYPIHGNSVGPKYQLRIQWHNASEWRHSHPHKHGEWAFRVDDQSLVPAHLYDAAEDAYQQWFRARYPHMAQLVDGRDYIRPAWLGSRDVAVEWDQTFHDAHCVLALRRYFWAKESGRHVCPRDIDPGHIGHCLDALDAVMFTAGPMTKHDPKQYMYWQTKVCFEGDEL